MNYNNLYNFVEIVKAGNITKAAKNLYLSQPTLSIHLKELEKEIGFPLFIRSKNKMILTEAGELLYHWAFPFFSQENDVINTISRLNNPQKNSLTIGIMGVGFLYELPNYINIFRSLEPDIPIHVKRMNWQPLVNALQMDLIDVSFQIITNQIPDFCSSLIIKKGVTSAFVPASSPLAEKSVLYPSDLVDYPFAIMNRSQEPVAYQGVLEFFQSENLKPHIQAEYDYVEPLLASVNMGEAVTSMSSLTVTDHFDNIRCIPVFPEWDVALAMIWKKNTKNQSTLDFVSFITKQLHLSE